MEETTENVNTNPHPEWTPVVLEKKPNRHVVLADGTKLKGQAAPDDTAQVLWVWIDKEQEATLGEMFIVFSDPEKTKKIENHTVDGIDPQVYEGYTQMTAIRLDGNSRIVVRMAKA